MSSDSAHIATTAGHGAKICEILGLDPNRTGNVRFELEPGNVIKVTAVIYPSVLQVNEITGLLESEIKQFKLVRCDE